MEDEVENYTLRPLDSAAFLFDYFEYFAREHVIRTIYTRYL